MQRIPCSTCYFYCCCYCGCGVPLKPNEQLTYLNVNGSCYYTSCGEKAVYQSRPQISLFSYFSRHVEYQIKRFFFKWTVHIYLCIWFTLYCFCTNWLRCKSSLFHSPLFDQKKHKFFGFLIQGETRFSFPCIPMKRSATKPTSGIWFLKEGGLGCWFRTYVWQMPRVGGGGGSDEVQIRTVILHLF